MARSKASEIDRTLAALADPARRRAVDLLRASPRRAGELAEALGVSAPVMSRHLAVLKQSGLVEEAHPEFDARVRIYSLRSAPMTRLRDWLNETEQMWSEQLAALRAHLDKTR